MSGVWEKEEHNLFKKTFRRYLKCEVLPNLEKWDFNGGIPRSTWRSFGEHGFLCPWVSSRYGGSECGFEYSAIINREIGRLGASSFMVGLHSDIVAPYIATYGSEYQKKRYLPGAVSGEILLAIAMTEPDCGSDLQAIKTTAVRDGKDWILNGQKTFISNGLCCDVVIVAAKSDIKVTPSYKGISLYIVEDGVSGFDKGRRLRKMGLHAQDTAEMFFSDCRVSEKNLLGNEGNGFNFLMQKLQMERLVCSLIAQGTAEFVLELVREYVKKRKVFGKNISDFQYNAFKVVEMATDIKLGDALLNEIILDYLLGKDIIEKVSMAKWWISEMVNRVAYQGVQLHGGYGYMEEFPICRIYRDVRVHPIFAGTNEVMKAVIARKIGL